MKLNIPRFLPFSDNRMDKKDAGKGVKVFLSSVLAVTTVIVSVLLLFAAWVNPDNNYNPLTGENNFIRFLKKQLSEYTEQMPEDRVYVQFDKPMYEPGETVWFSAFIRDGESLRPSKKSDIIHVELVSPKGNVEKTINLIAHNGKAAGDFSLDAETPGGMYKVRAYTNWMKNEGEETAFEKQIQVQDFVLPNLKMKLDFQRKAFGAGDEVIAKLELNTNENKPLSDHPVKFVANLGGQKFIEKMDITDEEGIKFIRFSLPKILASSDGLLNVMIDYNGNTESISRSIPIVLNKVKLEFFPEGGDLVNNLQTKVAFRALNEFNKPADVEGVVLDENKNRVAVFTSYHMGMGAFDFKPVTGKRYSAKITKPEGISASYILPEVYDRGYILNVDNSKAGEITLRITTTETEELAIVAQVRGKVHYSTVIKAVKGDNKIAFPTAGFPSGVAQITLFDNKNIARCERLVFVNKKEQLSISVTTDKEKYLPREKVNMTVSVRDERGMPVPASLSLAVVNDQLLSFADDKSGNILSRLLLEQDIKGKIEEPAFYFSKKENADKALDYLLMTAGWRRFTWEKVVNGETPAITYNAERAIVSGIILDAHTSQPVPHAKIKAAATGKVFKADEAGRFLINKLDLYGPQLLMISADKYYAQNQYVYSYGENATYYLYNNYYNNGSHNKGVTREEDMTPMAMRAVAVNDFDVVEEMAVMEKIEEAQPEKAKAAVPHDRRADFGFADKEEMAKAKIAVKPNEMRRPLAPGGATYYRAKEFAAPIYDKEENVETRTDFRNTIYWNPNVEMDRTGKANLSFYNSDDISSFRTTVEGISADGMIGRAEKTFFTQLPFAMTTKIPVEVATGDHVSIPVTLKNNTDKPLGGLLAITSPEGLKLIGELPSVQTIMPGKAKTIFVDYKVLDKIGEGECTVSFKACGLGDAFSRKIKIAPKGFPVIASFSGQDQEKEYAFEIRNMVNGSLKATFIAYPNVVSDLMKGIESILSEPSGCFEQTSMSSYPNAMVLDYLKSTGSKDDKTLARAEELLDKGYNRLITFETKEKGYEWFGSNPGHEALSAYGLMQFNDMKKAGGKVDQKMIDRTAEWLKGRRDGKGGFERNDRALDNFGRAGKEITDAYIVYALSEAGYMDIKKEFEASFTNAMKTKDSYMLGLVANAAYNLKETGKASQAVSALLDKQEEDGSWNGGSHSVTYSTGKSLTIETTSLAVLALLKLQKDAGVMMKGVAYIVNSRSGYGAFGNTQGTILALKALTEYAKFSKKTNEDGTVVLYVDGKKAGERSYKAGERGTIVIEGLEQYVKGEGHHELKVKYRGVKNPLPYSVSVSWSTFLPNSNKECVVDLQTKLADKNAVVGETLRLTATLTNKKAEGIPSAMAIVGIPAGFTFQPWQLKELQEKNVFDYYEIKGNNIAIYYRCMAPSAVKEISLDLKAEMPGEYDAPASSAYLYYTNEYKCWSRTGRVTIRKSGM